MSGEAERLLEAALNLPDAKRAELAAILTDSMGDGSPDAEIEAAWIEEAKRRLEEVRAGRSETVPAEEVHRKLRAMIEHARSHLASTGRRCASSSHGTPTPSWRRPPRGISSTGSSTALDCRVAFAVAVRFIATDAS